MFWVVRLWCNEPCFIITSHLYFTSRISLCARYTSFSQTNWLMLATVLVRIACLSRLHRLETYIRNWQHVSESCRVFATCALSFHDQITWIEMLEWLALCCLFNWWAFQLMPFLRDKVWSVRVVARALIMDVLKENQFWAMGSVSLPGNAVCRLNLITWPFGFHQVWHCCPPCVMVKYHFHCKWICPC